MFTSPLCIARLTRHYRSHLNYLQYTEQTWCYLDHHGRVGDVGPPRQGPGPAHHGVRLVVVDGEAPEQGEPILDLLHGLHLLLQDGQGEPPSLEPQGETGGYL